MRATVVGAGIMGLCAARSLMRRGVEVTIVDAQPPDARSRASSDHHRLIRLPYGRMKGYEAMAREAFNAWESLWLDLGRSHYIETGVMLIGDERSDWVHDSAKALGPRECRPMPHPEELLPGLRLRAGQSAFLAPMAGVLMADRILASLRDRIGAAKFVQAHVDKVGPGGQVTLSDGRSIEAEVVVVASGAWPWPKGSPSAPRNPSRQTALYLEQPAGWPAGPFILDLTQETSFYFVPGVLGTPAKLGTHTFSRSGSPEDDRSCTISERESLERIRRTCLPFCGDWPVVDCVANYYDVSPDERFLCRYSDRAVWLGGFSGHGFKFGPLIGERLADLMLGGGDRDVFQEWLAGRAHPHRE